MSEVLFEVFGLSVTVTAVYIATSVIVLLLFMSLWLAGRKKKTQKDIFAGQVMNGIGFGLLPAVSVLKAFQGTSTGRGIKLYEPLPEIRWMSVNGCFMPDRIEAAAALLCFILVCLWLIVKKDDIPDNGDLLPISVSIWASIRLVSEDFRFEPRIIFHYTSYLTLIACMILWCIRRKDMIRSPLRNLADLSAVFLCISVHLITTYGILSTGSEVGDFAVKSGSAFLALMLTLTAGGEVRKLIRKDEQGTVNQT